MEEEGIGRREGKGGIREIGGSFLSRQSAGEQAREEAGDLLALVLGGGAEWAGLVS